MGDEGSALPRLQRFDVVRRVGEGGSGLVYEAIDRERRARVALKMLRNLDAHALLRLKEEFRALADIEHPNLIRLGELACEGESWFFTMELVEGKGFVSYVSADAVVDHTPSHSVVRLDERIAAKAGRTRPAPAPKPHAFDEGRLRASLAQLARGLTALHAAGKVHRDIKPSNVLVTPEGRVVVLDFGLVRDAWSRPASDDGVVGTISHMAPEQAAGAEVGPEADWYAVGAMLYQCLTGRPPFEGDASDVLRRKRTEDPPRPSEIAPLPVPPDLDALCMDLLRRDPGARPSGAEVERRIDAGDVEPIAVRPVTMPARAPFVGREAELAKLRAWFEDAKNGQPVTVVVEGESGLGKSALVKRFTRGLGGDALVLEGRCYEREDVPYKAIDGVIDKLALHLASLGAKTVRELLPRGAGVLASAFPVLRRAAFDARAQEDATVDRTALFAALRRLFRSLAATRPLVVVVDDLQWADGDSLLLLSNLLRSPGAPAMMFVATARVAEDADDRETAFGLPGARVMSLDRLSAEEGYELARSLLGADEGARAIAEEAAGHPLFVDELVRHAQLSGGVAPAGVHLDEALFARVSRLDPASRRLLDVVAVAGVALASDVAERAAGLTEAEAPAVAQTLRTAHLARSAGARGQETIEPYHDRVREAVVARLDPKVRRALHESIATALESRGVLDADALSAHWLGAGDASKAGQYAQKAAEQAYAALAFERAAALYARALALGTSDEAGRQQIRVKLGESLANSGHGAEAARAFGEASDRASSPEGALELRRRAAEELLSAGLFDEGSEMLRAVLRAVAIGMPMTSIGALLSLLVYRLVLWLRGDGYQERAEHQLPARVVRRHDACSSVARALSAVDTVRGAYFQTRVLLFALELGEATRLASALAFEAVAVAAAGPRKATRAMRLIADSAAIAQRTLDPKATGVASIAAGYAYFLQGRFRESLTRCDQGGDILRVGSPGSFWERRMAFTGSAWALAWMGDVAELSNRVERGVREAEQRGDIYSTTTLRTGLFSVVWLARGDAEGARQGALEAARAWTQRGYHSQHYWVLLALAQVDLYQGDGRAAYARVAREWPKIRGALIDQVQLMGIEARHLRARTALAAASDERGRDRERMIRVATKDARALERIDAPLAQPFARLVRAGLAALAEDDHRAALELRAAASGFDGLDMDLHAKAARWQLARTLERAHTAAEREEGAELLVATERSMMAPDGRSRVANVAAASAIARMIAPGFRR